jgi:two-component system phosphate regulon sensor histidine kinase PhoR
LENWGIFIDVQLPTQPVFYRMGIQLFVSVGLTLLLIVCLIFQVKTILKQRKVNEIRENFVNTMVHELKRPVQTLKTFVSFLNDRQMRSDAETTEQVVRDSMFELDNLSAYLHKLKDMLQADSETTSLQISGFNLQDLVEKVIRLTHIPSGKGVTISPVYETDELNVEADPIHLANVLSNLIENAIKYSGNKVDIEIKVGRTKRKLWISVKDNGIGIPITEQDRVFTKFYRGNNIPDKTIPGIGLGLSYVKLIIEAHQGTINLNSLVGEGTTVTIYLPQ